MPKFTQTQISNILNKIAYHSFFREGKQYVTINHRAYRVNSLLNLIRCFGKI